MRSLIGRRSGQDSGQGPGQSSRDLRRHGPVTRACLFCSACWWGMGSRREPRTTPQHTSGRLSRPGPPAASTAHATAGRRSSGILERHATRGHTAPLCAQTGLAGRRGRRGRLALHRTNERSLKSSKKAEINNTAGRLLKWGGWGPIRSPWELTRAPGNSRWISHRTPQCRPGTLCAVLPHPGAPPTDGANLTYAATGGARHSREPVTRRKYPPRISRACPDDAVGGKPCDGPASHRTDRVASVRKDPSRCK